MLLWRWGGLPSRVDLGEGTMRTHLPAVSFGAAPEGLRSGLCVYVGPRLSSVGRTHRLADIT